MTSAAKHIAELILCAVVLLGVCYSAVVRDHEMLAAMQAIQVSQEQQAADLAALKGSMAAIEADLRRRAGWKLYSALGLPSPDLVEEIVSAWEQTSRRVSLQTFHNLIRVESRFDPGATSPKGAYGLLQLKLATGRIYGLSREELLQPRANLTAGAQYLDHLLDKTGGIEQALTAWTWGITRYRTGITTGEFARTVMGGKR